MTRAQRVYLMDILDRIRRIEEYASVVRDEFINSELREDGVVRCFEVIGEVVKRLDPALTAQYPDIPWKDFAGHAIFSSIAMMKYSQRNSGTISTKTSRR